MATTASQTFSSEQNTTPDYGPDLLPQHAKLLADSAITPDVAKERGYRSVTTKAELRRHGFSDLQCNVPALLIPIRNVAGNIATYQIRPDTPRIKDGRTLKYESPRNSRSVLDVPSAVRPQLGNPDETLSITEGTRKVDSAISHGLNCIGVTGVYGWRGTNDAGGTTALPDWESIALNGRTIYLAFDSDAWTNPNVMRALRRLARFLESRGAAVNIVRLPAGPNGEKVGLDDFFASGKTRLDLFDCVDADGLPDPEHAADGGETVSGPYELRDGQICYRKRGPDGDVSVPLCNFVARIVAEDVTDDGQTTGVEYAIAGRLANGAHLPTLRVPTRRFASLDWVSEWGARAVVAAGMGSKDRLREAIQRLSPNIPRHHIYTHPGWTRLEDYGWVYLHAGGAIGPNGPIDGIAARLTTPANLVNLPAPPTGAALVDAIGMALRMLDVAPDRIMVPLLGAVFRAALNAMRRADTAAGLVGESGTLKTELAASVQRFYGEAFDRLALPAAWSATANFLEKVAFDYKDCLCTVDDFAPSGTSYEIARYHQTAERVIRSAGNVAGRGRMNADGSLRATYMPRGFVLLTGEDVPRGQSVRARIVLLDVERGDVDKVKLATYQAGPGRAAPSLAMAGYLQWIAGHYDELAAALPDRLVTLRATFSAAGQHARTPDALANLALGWRVFLTYAVAADALTEIEAEALAARVLTALIELAAGQAAHQASEKPAERFLALLRAVLVKGDAHIADLSGDAPTNPQGWGWRERIVGTGDFTRQEWREQGARIGWLDGDDLYLEPQAAYSSAQRLGAGSGDELAVTLPTLKKRLHQAGYLVTTEQATSRQTLTVRKTIGKTRQDVLHLAAATLFAKSDQPDHDNERPDDSRTASAFSGQVFWSGFGDDGENLTAQPDHESRKPDHKLVESWANLANLAGNERNGRVGQVSDKREGVPTKNLRADMERCYACGTLKARGGVCPVCHPPASNGAA